MGMVQHCFNLVSNINTVVFFVFLHPFQNNDASFLELTGLDSSPDLFNTNFSYLHLL